MRIADKELRELLLASDKVKPADLRALKLVAGQSLAEAVVATGLISQTDLTKLYAKVLDLPFVELASQQVPEALMKRLGLDLAQRYQAVPFKDEDGEISVALAEPDNETAIKAIEAQLGDKLKLFVASPDDLARVLKSPAAATEPTKRDAVAAPKVAAKTASAATKTADKTAGRAVKPPAKAAARTASKATAGGHDLSDAAIAKTVDLILEYAIGSRASHIHLEPRPNQVQVRYRIDGVLHESMTLPKTVLAAIVARIKTLAHLPADDLAPQTGQFSFTAGKSPINLNLSILPVVDGPKIVMELVDRTKAPMKLEEIGLEGPALDSVKRNLERSQGLILVSGPAGSGITTTLYSFITTANRPGSNLSTVETSTTIHLPGVNQTEVGPNVAALASGLVTLLRGDPNIIMVGELPDGTAADLAAHTALTGHLILAGLHAPSATASLGQLLNMGLAPFLVASTVTLVVAERLVRRLCPACRQPYQPTQEQLAGLAVTQPTAPLPPAPDLPHKERVIKPLHSLGQDRSILARITADPNILNRPAGAIGLSTAPPPPLEPISAETKPAASSGSQFYEPGPGCAQCGPTGYSGQLGIFEVLEVTDAIQRLIVAHAAPSEIELAAAKAGLQTLTQDGLAKAARGLTSISEVLRVTRV